MVRFNATVRSAVLTEVTNVVSALVEEAVFEFTDDGLTVRVMDPANVGMARVTAPASVFDAYETDGTRLGIQLDKLSDLLGMADADAPVEMELNEETRKLEIHVSGLEYTMALIDPSAIRSADEVPDLPFGAVVRCPQAEFGRAVKAAGMVSDHLRLSVADGVFEVSASGDTDGIDFASDAASVGPGANDVVEDCSAMFSLDYVQEVLKPLSCNELSVSLADDMPFRLDFPVVDGEGEGMFFLAPRLGKQ